MYFAMHKGYDDIYVGNTLQDLLKDIEENAYDGTDIIPDLDFYAGSKITVKYESKLTQVITKSEVKKPVAKKVSKR